MMRFRGRARLSAVVILLALAVAPSASAQARFEIGASLTWTGGFDAGGVDALETRNPSTGTSPLTLFGTSSRVGSAAGARGHVAFFVTSRVAVEAAFEYSRPVLATAIVGDFENATGTEATNRISSYLAGGSVLYHFGTARLVPFVSGGAAWSRQLDDDRVSEATGTEFHAGGGVKYRLSDHLDVRGEAAVSSRDKSLAFEDKRRTVPIVAAGAAFRF